MQPGFPPAHGTLWTALYKEGRYDEAVRHAAPVLAARTDPEIATVVAERYPALGYAGAMKQAADTMAARASERYVSPVQVATLYAHAGEQALALDWLERAIDVRDTGIVYAPISPEFEELWDHPRFREVMRRTNLPPPLNQ